VTFLIIAPYKYSYLLTNTLCLQIAPRTDVTSVFSAYPWGCKVWF